jgi:hypothetical protein
MAKDYKKIWSWAELQGRNKPKWLAYSSQQNRRAERAIRQVTKITRCLLIDRNTPPKLLHEVLCTAVHILNKFPPT